MNKKKLGCIIEERPKEIDSREEFELYQITAYRKVSNLLLQVRKLFLLIFIK